MDRAPLSQHIAYMNRGLFDDEATEELAKLVKAVRETGKKGQLVVTLEVKMFDRKTEDAMTITPTVVAKLPKPEARKNVFFSTYDGDLTRNDPHQEELNLREVPSKQHSDHPPKKVEGNNV